MIKIEVATTRSGSTWDAMLGAIWEDLTCDHCRLITKVQLRDIKLQRTIVCRGCKRNFRLIDYLGKYIEAERTAKRAEQALLGALTSQR